MSILLQPLGTITDQAGQRLAEVTQALDQQLLCTHWFGNLTGQEIVDVGLQIYQLPGIVPFELLLNDKREATGDWSEALDWLEFEGVPQAVAGGLRAIAYVFAPDMHNQLASRRFVERLSPYLQIKVFYDMPTALHWLGDLAGKEAA